MARTTAHSRAGRRLVEELRLLEVKEAAQHDPKALIAEINAFDPTTLEKFSFTMYPADDDPLWPYREPRGDQGWLFQAGVVDWWMGIPNPIHELMHEWSPNFHFDPDLRVFLNLKARQLGITWCGMAVELWYMLFRPGSKCVAYSYNEDEAKKLVSRAWLMYKSLPEVLRDHVEIITPRWADEPSEWIKVRHKESGLISTIQALPSTKKAGHGDTITFGLLDEFARQDYAKQTFTAMLPATARGNARLAIVSTANGVGDIQSEEGNFFHILYATKKERNLGFSFLPWNAEPTRDEDWYAKYAMKLGEVERNQQYPLNEQDAFMLSGALYFDREALRWYREHMRRPILSGQFVQHNVRRLNWMNLRDGIIEMWERPVDGRKYAIGVDTSTGRAADFTSAGVIDLETGAIVAELHAKLDAPRAAIQLQALGRLFNMAKICIETQGGYGDALVILLKDGHKGLPPYSNLYRHRDSTQGKKPITERYGMPMGPKNRPQIIDGLFDWLRLRLFPWLSSGCVSELGTFAYADTNPSPRALDGCNDDRVMMLGLTVEMFRQFGKAPTRRRRKGTTKYEPHPSRSV